MTPDPTTVVSLLESLNKLAGAGILGFMLLFLLVIGIAVFFGFRFLNSRTNIQGQIDLARINHETEQQKVQNLLDIDLRRIVEATANAIDKAAAGIQAIDARHEKQDSTLDRIATTLSETAHTLSLLRVAQTQDSQLLVTFAKSQTTFEDSLKNFSLQIDGLSTLLREWMDDTDTRGHKSIGELVSTVNDIKQQFATIGAEVHEIKQKVKTQELPVVVVSNEVSS